MKLFKLSPIYVILILLFQTSLVFAAQAVLGPIPLHSPVEPSQLSVSPPLMETFCDDCIKDFYGTGKASDPDLVQYHSAQIFGGASGTGNNKSIND